uniref:KIB1-4 beta-propeller domain-containing protein n=1 Tax=Chenopodium quinoa TaxID=63459 RepID=A0A803M9A0_CHEQI
MIYKLHPELITKIAEHIEFYEDFETFGKLCTCWRKAMKLADRSAASRQTPQLMLAPESGNIYSKDQLYSFHSRKISKLDLPTPEDDPDGMWQYIVSSSHGCLFYVNDTGAVNIVISLVHPISKEAIRTPELPTCFFQAEDSDDVHTVAIWNSKENYWVVKELSADEYEMTTNITVTFHKEEFYICDESSKTIVGFVIKDDAICTRLLFVKPPWEEAEDREKIYLVGSGDALLLVRCKLPNPSRHGTFYFRM